MQQILINILLILAIILILISSVGLVIVLGYAWMNFIYHVKESFRPDGSEINKKSK